MRKIYYSILIAHIALTSFAFSNITGPIPAYIRVDESFPTHTKYVGILEGSATATFTIVIHIWDRREGAYVTRNAYTSTGVLLKNAVPTIIVIPRESNGGLELPE